MDWIVARQLLPCNDPLPRNIHSVGILPETHVLVHINFSDGEFPMRGWAAPSKSARLEQPLREVEQAPVLPSLLKN